jgi:1,4-alpha-glucan branching enzyme
MQPSVSFEFEKPEAGQVFVAGSFNGWKPDSTPLQRTSAGQWVGKLPLSPGKHEYLFVVDGQWLPDPKAAEAVQNPFGGVNSVVSVAE